MKMTEIADHVRDMRLTPRGTGVATGHNAQKTGGGPRRLEALSEGGALARRGCRNSTLESLLNPRKDRMSQGLLDARGE